MTNLKILFHMDVKWGTRKLMSGICRGLSRTSQDLLGLHVTLWQCKNILVYELKRFKQAVPELFERNRN